MPVLLAALGSLLISLDSSMNISFPAMAAAFGVGPVEIRWVIISYVLTYALTSFAAGVLADRLGPRPVFAAGLWLTAASLAGHVAGGTLAAVLLLRVAQGVGAGLVYGTAPALVTLSTPTGRHGRGLGLLALGLGAGLSIGPAVGGPLVEAFGWPAVLLYRAPIAVLLALAAGAVPVVGRAGGAWHLPPREEWRRWRVLSTLLLAALANWAQFAVWLLVPFYLVEVRGLRPSVGGLLFMLMPLGTAVAGPVGGFLSDRVGHRGPMVAGLVAEAAGLGLIATLGVDSPGAVVALALGLAGFGLGVFQVPNLARTMAAFPLARQGAAGGLAFMSRTLGVVAGVQASASLFGALETRAGFGDAFTLAFAGAAAVCAFAALLAAVPAGEGRPGGDSTGGEPEVRL